MLIFSLSMEFILLISYHSGNMCDFWHESVILSQDQFRWNASGWTPEIPLQKKLSRLLGKRAFQWHQGDQSSQRAAGLHHSKCVNTVTSAAALFDLLVIVNCWQPNFSIMRALCFRDPYHVLLHYTGFLLFLQPLSWDFGG